MKWSRAIAVGLVAAQMLAVAAMLPSTVQASPPVPIGVDTGAMPPPGVGPSFDVVDAEAFAEIADITERITPHLFVGEGGLVHLDDVTAAELDVSEQFLADFREALRYSNALIERGEIDVAPDMTVNLAENFLPPANLILPPGGDSPNGGDLGALPMASDAAVPDWGAWNYGSGGMFYNSYNDWVYYRYRYYGLCNTMAAYIGFPWMGPPLIYFYGYNQHYFGLYVYNPYGTYFYIPYYYCHFGLGYKPAYFWVRMFDPFRGYVWGWRGFWLRY